MGTLDARSDRTGESRVMGSSGRALFLRRLLVRQGEEALGNPDFRSPTGTH